MGNKNHTILTLNGRHYNAVTGESVSAEVAAKSHAVRPIDDVVAGKHAAAKPSVKPTHKTTAHTAKAISTPKPATGKVMDVQHVPHHARPHPQQHATTLMRSSVHKPAPGHRTKAVTRTDILAKVPDVVVAPKWSVEHVDPVRLARAEHVAKSRLIRKFSAGGQPDASFVQPTVVAPAVPPPKPLANEPNQSLDIFERAIAQSTSHEEKYISPRKAAKVARKQAKHAKHKAKVKPHHRLPSIVAASIAVLLLAGFVAYQNKANITLRYADAKAGFHATLPGFKPTGFALGKFSYGTGFVTLSFHNSASGRNFSVQQQTSNWNSQTLLDNYVSLNTRSYQTLQSADRTIYVYGNNNASWVNHGVWYQLNSNGNLSTSDILSVASSM